MPKTPYDFIMSPKIQSGADRDLIISTLQIESQKQYIQWVAKRTSIPSKISMTARLETTGKGEIIQRCTAAEAALELIEKQTENSLVLLNVFNLLDKLGNQTSLVEFSRVAMMARDEIRKLVSKRVREEYND